MSLMGKAVHLYNIQFEGCNHQINLIMFLALSVKTLH